MSVDIRMHHPTHGPARGLGTLALVLALGACVDAAVDPGIPHVASVTMAPASLMLVAGQTGQLTATVRDSAGSVLTGREIGWSSSRMAVATVGDAGLVTAVGAGTATITATSEGQSASATVTVTPPPVASVTVTPSSLSLEVGQTGQLTATLRDAAGHLLTGRTVTWTSAQPGRATVNSSGLVTAQSAGTATITATSEGQSGSATVTVTNPAPPPVASVTVTPSSLSLQVGQTGQLTATLRDAAGNILTGRTVTWSTSAVSVATVSGSGLVTAQGAGTATITATSEGQGGSATVTVTQGSGSITGLDFAGNVNWPSASPSAIMAWNLSRTGTAPFAAYPATYIWRAYPRSQSGWWTFLFHAGWWDTWPDPTTEYYGAHPYQDGWANPLWPDPPEWEISSHGADEFSDPVVFDRWYTQVVVTSQSGANETITYYWNWPNTTTDLVTVTRAGGGVSPDLTICVGDAPWNRGFEAPNAILRGLQYYDRALSLTEIAQEIASPGSVQSPWYLNLNPTPTDIADKSGNGNHPGWVGAARPGLWTGSGSGAAEAHPPGGR